LVAGMPLCRSISSTLAALVENKRVRAIINFICR
jgi:hypothetical protein